MKMSFKLALLAIPALLVSCGDEVTAVTPPKKIANLFPAAAQGDWWKFSDKYGNEYSFTATQFLKMGSGIVYTEIKAVEKNNGTETTSFHCFKNDSTNISYNGKEMMGNYTTLFLPLQFSSASGSYTSTGSQSVSYTISDAYTSRDTTFSECAVLNFATPIITGFNQMVFANNVGPIELGDKSSVRIPPYYLDSASIGGVVKRFPKK